MRLALRTTIVLALAAPSAAAQEVGSATVVPLQVTGDPATRFVLVVMGDGYTAAELPKYRAHVDKHMNVLWSIEPFRSYRNYINVYSVEIVSGESGITCDPEVRLQKRTPLNMRFGGGCENINARGISVDSVARRYARMATPHYDQLLAIANTDTYGGIGGRDATTSGGNALGPLITPHELGHSLGRLGDEYTYSARGQPGGTYAGAEPASPHFTLLTEEEMRAQQKKWWRWLGEESESGGEIGRHEGGQGNTRGVWRPSKHSMMISLGYYFDQVSRERMTHRISLQVELIAAATPSTAPVGRNEVLWIETANPVYHELQVTWRLNGQVVPNPRNLRQLELRTLNLAPGTNTVTVTVVDPTEFVRDPVVRDSSLTATRTWTIGTGTTPARAVEATFTAARDTARPVGGQEVVYVATSQPVDRVLDVTWRLNGEVVNSAHNARHFPLARQNLPAGTHTLTATVSDPANPRGRRETRSWRVDNTGPAVTYELSRPDSVVTRPDGARHYFVREQFTMKLNPTDDQPGYVVAEFRVNGDGWHHYYGWPDAPPGTPFRFTPSGTKIKELIYGSLSSEGLSPQPWEARAPGWGTHRIDYRAIDAAGNIGTARTFYVTLSPR